MQQVSTLPFSHLKNAEHVAFFNNVVLEISKYDETDFGLPADKLTKFKNTAHAEQDIVLKAQGSMYTADMLALDEERDRIYRMIRLKLQAVCLSSEVSALYTFKAPLEKYILGKYNAEIVSLAYQEESAHIAGFILDMLDRFDDEELEAMGVDDDINSLKHANDTFSEFYNQRASERAISTTELTKKQRAETEAQYDMIRLYIEYTANNVPDTTAGMICSNIIGVINEYVKDARQRLNARLGRSEVYDDADFSPIPYPDKQS